MKRAILWGAAFVASNAVFAGCVGDEPNVTVGDTPDGGGQTTDEGGVVSEGGTVTDEGGKTVSAPPTHQAQSIDFVDVDLAPTVGGFIRIKRALDESDVASYVVYAVDAGGTRLGTPFRKASATGSDLSIKIDDGSSIPAGATQLLVVTSNAIGEMTDGRLTRFANATAHSVAVTDASSTIPRAVGSPSKVVFDEAHRKLVVVTSDLSAFQCDLDGTGCTRHDISGGKTIPLSRLTVAVDAANGRLLVSGGHADAGAQLPLWISPLDFSKAATFADISGGAGADNIHSPSFAIDAAGAKLHTVTTDANGRSMDFVCNLDGTVCASGVEIFTTGNAGSFPSAVYDPAGKSLIVASNVNQSPPPLYRLYCPGTSACTQVSTPGAPGTFPMALLGPAANLLVVATDSITNQASLVPCPLTSTTCQPAVALTPGTAADAQARIAAAAVDALGSKLVLATSGVASSGLDSNPSSLGRCGTDGAGCTFVDFSATNKGAVVSITVDPESGQIFGLSQGTSTGSSPSLFFLE